VQKTLKLFEHQKRAVARSMLFPFQLIVRSPGTGKTLIGINIALNQIQQNRCSHILWIGPANLENQYRTNFKRFSLDSHSIFPDRTIQEGCCNLCSFDMMRLNEQMLCGVNWDLILVDEIHKAKNILTKTNQSLWNLRKKTKRLYAFTGTPFQNHPYEFFELVSLCVGKHVTLDCEECLEYRFPRHTPIRNFLRRIGFHLSRVNQGPIIGIKDAKHLQDVFHGVVDYLPQEKYHQECHLPEVKIRSINIEMDQDEVRKYRECLKQFSRKKKFQHFVSDKLDDTKIAGFFNGLNGLRTVAMSHSKLVAAVNEIKHILKQTPNARILVFSNFVENGLRGLSHELNLQEIPHLFYYGNITPKRRDSFISDYLSGKKQVMLLSPVGFEGLDLYGTTNVIIVDPHYNPERTTQLISRAVRAFSSVAKIDVVQFLSVSSQLKGKIIDESIIAIADRKKKLAEMLQAVLISDSRF
jgi:superfamily II DNA or RNA helicase